MLWRDPPRRRIGSLVCFDAGGAAHAVPVRACPIALRYFPYTLLLRLSAPPLRTAWRRLFALQGAGWIDWNSRRSRAIAVGLALMFGWFGAHWFYLCRRRRGVVYACLLPVAILLSFVDALRFVWIEQARFESRYVASRGLTVPA